MNIKQIVSLIQKIPEARALYTYKMTQEIFVPILVVTKSTQESIKQLEQLDLEAVIIVTTDDLTHWHDVYGINLLHMFLHSTLEWWEHLLEEVVLSKEHMRLHIEWMIRHMLIDLREYAVQGKMLWDLMPRLEIQSDRIWFACWFLLDADLDVLSDIIQTIQKEWWIDHQNVYNTIHHGTWWVGLFDIHESFIDLLKIIDWLEV